MRAKYTIKYLNKPILEPVISGRVRLKRAANQEFHPNSHILRAIGREIIQGFRGGPKLTSIRVNPNGTVTHSSGRHYPYGILQGMTPDGRPYHSLKKSTIKYKMREGKWRHATMPLRFRDLSDPKALVSNLVAKTYKGQRDLVEVRFRNSATDELSQLHEKGRKRYPSSTFVNKKTKKPLMVKIPARPHRAVQTEVTKVISRILEAWAKKDAGRSI